MPRTPSFPAGGDDAGSGPVGGALDPVFVFGAAPGDGVVPAADRHAVDAGPAGGGRAGGGGAGGAMPVSGGPRPNWLLGRNVPIRRFARVIERAAEVGATVLLRGEAGTGKELWARLLHRAGPRCCDPFVVVECAALAPDAAAIRLFGQRPEPARDEYTRKRGEADAAGDAPGALVEAGGGVLFLNAIEALPLGVQSGLLRALEQREVVPVGGGRPVPIDVQVVAATRRHLEQEVVRGGFDRRLHQRLTMLELRVPPLRERIEDIPTFVEFFSRRIAARRGQPLWMPSAAELATLCAHAWPGNVRELEQVIEGVYLRQAGLVGTAPACGPAPLDRLADGAGVGSSAPLGDALVEALAATSGTRPSAGGLDGVRGSRVSTLLGRFPDRR